MRVILIILLGTISVTAYGQSQSMNYQSGVSGLFTHGAITSSAHYTSKVVNTWTEGQLQTSTHYRNQLSIGTSLDSLSTSVRFPNAQSVSFTIYPNPANQQLNIVSTFVIEKVEVFSLAGELVKMVQPSNKIEVNLDLRSLYAGMYLVKVKIGNQVVVKRVNKL